MRFSIDVPEFMTLIRGINTCSVMVILNQVNSNGDSRPFH
jgi:hypothetical protein